MALADWAYVFYGDVQPQAAELAQHVTPAVAPALDALGDALASCAWDKASISAAFKTVLAAHGLKMPQLAMPVRVLTVGTAHTPISGCGAGTGRTRKSSLAFAEPLKICI